MRAFRQALLRCLRDAVTSSPADGVLLPAGGGLRQRHARLVRSFLDVDGVGSGLGSLPLLLSPGGKASWAICFTQWAKGKGARLGLIWEAQSLLVSKWMGWDFSHGTLPSTKECNSQFL